MSFAGVVFACWLGIAGVAFLALSGLGRLAARGDIEADLGIVGDAELRMLVGERNSERPGLEARLAQFALPATHNVRPSEGAGYGATRYASAGYRT